MNSFWCYFIILDWKYIKYQKHHIYFSSSLLHISSTLLSFISFSPPLYSLLYFSFTLAFLPSFLSSTPSFIPLFLPLFLPSFSDSRGDYHVAAVADTRNPRCTQTHTRGTYSTVQWVTVRTKSTQTQTQTHAHYTSTHVYLFLTDTLHTRHTCDARNITHSIEHKTHISHCGHKAHTVQALFWYIKLNQTFLNCI